MSLDHFDPVSPEAIVIPRHEVVRRDELERLRLASVPVAAFRPPMVHRRPPRAGLLSLGLLLVWLTLVSVQTHTGMRYVTAALAVGTAVVMVLIRNHRKRCG